MGTKAHLVLQSWKKERVHTKGHKKDLIDQRGLPLGKIPPL